ncbi:hypothetical protein BGP75_25075 [Motiliproteus sp. MSK22-1]|nr:hypothetical protein BGP75_25075 [Motiliproteus sp. MSK22-1]
MFPRLSVRARLLLTFAVLSCSAMTLAIVGWLGLSNTESAFLQFEQQALPDISRSLELAERTANLAAVAPYVASASGPFILQGENQLLRQKIKTVLTLARDLPQLDAAAPNLKNLLVRLDLTIDELIELTRQQLFLREDVRQFSYRLGLLDRLPGSDEFISVGAWLEDLLLAATHATTVEELERIRGRMDQVSNAAAMAELSANNNNRLQAELINQLFERRRDQLRLQKRSGFLLSSTRAISEQLTGEVKLFVDQLREDITSQSQRIGGEVASGKTGILVISLLCIIAALGGVWRVKELVNSLTAVTALMTRLASGDRQQQPPAINRRDEIGDLTRAFQVFRKNAVQMDRMTDHLQEQSRLLETVFQNINDGLSVFDHEGKLVTWNPQYLSIMELPDGLLKQGMSIERVHGFLPRYAKESVALDGVVLDMEEVNLLRKQKPQRFERHFSNGKVVEFRSSPMPDGGFVTLYSNLTERKAIEAQLRQSQKMEVLGQLTGGVAHDFNNLLAAIVGNLQLLESKLLEAEQGQNSKQLIYARRALAAAERGSNLTQRLLAFARKQRLEPEPVQVDGLIEGMLDLIEYSVAPTTDIRLYLKSEDWIVNVDPVQLENALLNLAINSSSAMPENGQLTFTTQQSERLWLNGVETDAVVIRVTDTGSGIADEHLSRVFEPFFSTKEIGEGSGLGLSMVYGFVKQSGGDIRVQSEVGQGTRIEILLPRAETTIKPMEVQGSLVDTEPLPAGQGERILVVEDDVSVCAVADEMLQNLGYRVLTANSAEQALSILSGEDKIDLLFADVNLGAGMNGIHLCEQVKQCWPEITVLLTSGLNRIQLEERYRLNESTPVVAKPYYRSTVARALSRSLREKADEIGPAQTKGEE